MRVQRICADCGLDFTDICPGGVKLDGVWYCLVHAQKHGWIHPRDRDQQKRL